jgi:LysM repeat protein
MDFNKNIPLQPSATVKIPTQQDFINQPVKLTENKPIGLAQTSIHKVKPGETLYGIANKYNVSIEFLKNLNNLRSSALSIGQEIKVPSNEIGAPAAQQVVVAKKEEVGEVKVEILEDNSGSSIDSTENSNVEIPRNKYGITEMNDKGLAMWMEGDNLDDSKSYALHKTAPVGTIIRITNPMTSKSVFAKVVGKFTDNENTKDVIIVISRTSAEAIGAIDKRFLVTITFGIPNEQQ